MRTKKDILSQRAYSWNIITYCDKNSIELLKSLSSKYAIAYHDKDLKEDGSPKENHYHILSTFKQQISLNSIKRKCEINCNILGLTVKDKAEEYLYLTHKNHLDKYQYDDSIIDTNSKKYWFNELSKEEEINQIFIKDLCKETPYKMAVKYGKDYIKNYSKYEEFKDILLNGQRYQGNYKGLTGIERIELDIPLKLLSSDIDIDDELFGNNSNTVSYIQQQIEKM